MLEMPSSKFIAQTIKNTFMSVEFLKINCAEIMKILILYIMYNIKKYCALFHLIAGYYYLCVTRPKEPYHVSNNIKKPKEGDQVPARDVKATDVDDDN
jgi:hypothetical protein